MSVGFSKGTLLSAHSTELIWLIFSCQIKSGLLVCLSLRLSVCSFVCLSAYHSATIGPHSKFSESDFNAFKVGVLKKKSAALAIPAEVCGSASGPGSSRPGVESFSKFDSQQI